MELTSTRKRANAITSNIFNRIAIRGQRNIASQLGVDESQITRWKSSMIPKMSMLLAILEWGVEDEELSNLAKQVALLLTKDKAPSAGALEA
ncbi:CII family transcriptional regulator [Cronobacter malonaticus]